MNRKTIFSGLAFCLVTNLILAQSEIERLDFPYHKGYHMYFEGQAVSYIYESIYKYNRKPDTDTVVSTMTYYIDNEYPDKKDTVVNFTGRFTNGDNMSTFNSNPLIVGEDGMFYWKKNNDSDSTSYENDNERSKKEEKQKYYDIKTPLKAGKKWSRKDVDAGEVEYMCTNTDTLIETGLGPLRAFVIKETQTVTSDRSKDIVSITITYQYYAQGTGKIGIDHKSYAHLKSENVDVLYHEESIRVQKVWWDEK